MQQGDVLLFQTVDDGNITVEGGIVTMSSGLETSAYLSMFGGNEEDDGRDQNPRNWWGNLDETELARQYRSETQHILQSLPATTGNLLRVEDAANRDLAWLLNDRVASSVTVVATIPALNRVTLSIDIDAVGLEQSFEFTENWRASG